MGPGGGVFGIWYRKGSSRADETFRLVQMRRRRCRDYSIVDISERPCVVLEDDETATAKDGVYSGLQIRLTRMDIVLLQPSGQQYRDTCPRDDRTSQKGGSASMTYTVHHFDRDGEMQRFALPAWRTWLKCTPHPSTKAHHGPPGQRPNTLQQPDQSHEPLSA